MHSSLVTAAFTFPASLNSRWPAYRGTICHRRKSLHLPLAKQSPSSALEALNTSPPSDANINEISVSESVIRQGIKSISVGKYGEKPIPHDIIPPISLELALIENSYDQLMSMDFLFLRASFLGSLFMKQSLSVEEHRVLMNATVLPRTSSYAAGRSRLPDEQKGTSNNTSDVNPSGTLPVTAGHVIATVAFSDDNIINSPLSQYAFRLLCGEQLNMSDAEQLGDLLYTDEPLSPMKALIAHVMRVRHETSEEISGLARSIASSTTTLSELGIRDELVLGEEKQFVLMAEPFDGTLTWDLLTPLIARHLQQKHGLRVVIAAGESSGPKYGPNVLSLYNALQDAGLYEDDMGLVTDQAQTNKGAARWVEMRRIILKRPSLATTEKYADPCPGNRAEMFIGSAFHPGYLQKMADAAEAIGYNKYLVVSKGMEGCIGLGVGNRRTQVLVGWKNEDDQYCRHELKFRYHDEDDDGDEVEEDKKKSCTVQRTVERIRLFLRDGSSGNKLFDKRVDASCELLDQAMYLIQSMQQEESVSRK